MNCQEELTVIVTVNSWPRVSLFAKPFQRLPNKGSELFHRSLYDYPTHNHRTTKYRLRQCSANKLLSFVRVYNGWYTVFFKITSGLTSSGGQRMVTPPSIVQSLLQHHMSSWIYLPPYCDRTDGRLVAQSHSDILWRPLSLILARRLRLFSNSYEPHSRQRRLPAAWSVNRN